MSHKKEQGDEPCPLSSNTACSVRNVFERQSSNAKRVPVVLRIRFLGKFREREESHVAVPAVRPHLGSNGIDGHLGDVAGLESRPDEVMCHRAVDADECLWFHCHTALLRRSSGDEVADRHVGLKCPSVDPPLRGVADGGLAKREQDRRRTVFEHRRDDNVDAGTVAPLPVRVVNVRRDTRQYPLRQLGDELVGFRRKGLMAFPVSLQVGIFEDDALVDDFAHSYAPVKNEFDIHHCTNTVVL